MRSASRVSRAGDHASDPVDAEGGVQSSRFAELTTGGWWLLIIVILTFLIYYGSVLIGQKVMIGGGLLAACCYPWAATPGPHPVQNVLNGDPLTEILPWQIVISQAIRSGQLPLWNPYALWGSPLLANNVSGAVSPFTWLALVFPPAQGLSIAMLAKMWVAGVGMALYLRLLGVRGLGQVVGGVGFAASSFMVVWLEWPQTSVACMLPWAFAAVEWYLRSGHRWAWCATAVAIGLQFLGGHAEVSLHLALGVTIYSVVRWVFSERKLSRLIYLAAAGAIGVALAAIQLVPFAVDLQGSAAGAFRLGAGTNRLSLTDLATWLIPNGHGNPSIEHVAGPLPNYAEAVGFAGVTLLVMVVPGLVLSWRRIKGPTAAVAAVGIVAAGTAYGPLNEVIGRLPAFDTAANTRILVLLCFVVPALGALGIDALCIREGGARWSGLAGVPLLALGMLGTLGLAAAGVLVGILGARVATIVPDLPRLLETFWVGVSLVTLVGAVAYLLYGLLTRHGTWAAAGLGVLVLIEALIFSVPYQPRSDPAAVPPPTALTSWLQEHEGNHYIAATGHILPPETATLYGLHDARAYDLLLSPRAIAFWAAGDPAFSTAGIQTTLGQPKADWLALAGVKYILTAPGADIPGTKVVTRLSDVDVGLVPDVAAYASVSSTWRVASSATGAVQEISARTLGAPVLENAPANNSVASSPQSSVRVAQREAQSVTIAVHATTRVALTVRQSYASGWSATIDGRSTAVYPADIAFQGIIVPAGEHVVVLRYQPSSVTIGIAGSLGGLAVILAVLVAPLLLRRTRLRPRRDRRAGAPGDQHGSKHDDRESLGGSG